METQNQINRTLSQSEAREYVRSLLSFNQGITRTELANQLCDKFGFFDPRGERQRAGCIKALRELEQEAHSASSAWQPARQKEVQRRLVEGVAEAKEAPVTSVK